MEKIDSLRIIIKEIAESKKFDEKWFIFSIVVKSEYIQAMIKKFKDDVYKNVKDELRKSYPPYTDSFFTDIVTPPGLFLSLSRPNSEQNPIENWYKHRSLWDRHFARQKEVGPKFYRFLEERKESDDHPFLFIHCNIS
jgi:hypothetical protein